MIQHFSAHPETQVSVMMENNEIMAKYRHKGALPAAWFFSVHDTSSRRKKKDTREKDNVWRKSEQALVRRKLNELLRNLESAKCVRKFISHCDSIGTGQNDRKIGKTDFIECIDKTYVRKIDTQKDSSTYQQYFNKLQGKS